MHREWCYRRWINPQSLEDLQHIQEQLVKFQQYPDTRSLTLEGIRSAVYEICEGCPCLQDRQSNGDAHTQAVELRRRRATAVVLLHAAPSDAREELSCDGSGRHGGLLLVSHIAYVLQFKILYEST